MTELDVELAQRISAGPWGGLVDPLGQGPAVWFQRMDAPRPQRNRIHVDVSVPHDEAEPRIQAALAAGGTAEPIYDRTGGGQPPWVQISSRRPAGRPPRRLRSACR